MNEPLAERYSAVEVEASGEIAVVGDGARDLEATHHIRVDGRIDARGAPGAHASGRSGGTDGTFGGGGGAGRDENDLGRYPLPPDDREAGLGGDRLLATGVPDQYWGQGGHPGRDLESSFIDAIVDAIELLSAAFSCVTTLNPVSCFYAVILFIDVIQSGSGAIDAISVPGGEEVDFHGEGGRGGRAGGGGGGGGGGGFDQGVLDDDAGGGGGAGGEPGRSISLTSPGVISVGGEINTAGGAGGNGARWEEGFVGGGGGGGGAGLLPLSSGLPLAVGGLLWSGPGIAGRPGCVYMGDDDVPCTFYHRSRGRFGESPPPVLAAPGQVGPPALDQAPLAGRVSPVQLLPVSVSASADAVSVRVVGEGAGPACGPGNCSEDCGSCTFPLAAGGGGEHTGQVTLFKGFNHLEVLPSVGPAMVDELELDLLVLARDRDGDGLIDTAEEELGTDPDNPDADGDGLMDGQEYFLGFDPLADDSDLDGLGDADELAAGTDPRDSDTDSDRFNDGAEILLVGDPTDCASFPYVVPDATFLVGIDGALAVLDPTTGDVGVLSVPVEATGPLGPAFVDGELFVAGGDHILHMGPLDGEVWESVALTGPTLLSLAQDGYYSWPYVLATESVDGAPTGQILIVTAGGSLPGISPHGSPHAEPLRALARNGGQLYAVVVKDGASDALATLTCEVAVGCPLDLVELGTIEDPRADCTPDTCPTTVTAIAFSAGVLYAIATHGEGSTLMTVDPGTMATTWLADIDGQVTGLTIAPIAPPRPATCTIDGTEYEPGDPDPDRDCYGCDPARDPDAWVVCDGYRLDESRHE